MAGGAVIANISRIASVDQVAYDPTANLYFASAYQDRSPASALGSPSPVLAVIDASTNKLVQTFATDNVTAHSVAVDTVTNNLLVPETKMGGIQIYNLQMTATGAYANSTNTTVYANVSSTSTSSSSSAPAPTTSTSDAAASTISLTTTLLTVAVVGLLLSGL